MDRKDLAQASEASRPGSPSRTSSTGINQLLREALSPSRSPSPPRSRRSGRDRSRSPAREGRRDESYYSSSRRDRDDRYRSHRSDGRDYRTDYDRRNDDQSRRYDDRSRHRDDYGRRPHDGHGVRGRSVRDQPDGRHDNFHSRDRNEPRDHRQRDHLRRYDDFSDMNHPSVPRYGGLAERITGGPQNFRQDHRSFSHRAPDRFRGHPTSGRPLSPVRGGPQASDRKRENLPIKGTARRQNVSYSQQDPQRGTSFRHRQEPLVTLSSSLPVASSSVPSQDIDNANPTSKKREDDVEMADEPQVPLDETALLEERRKRREAIKAKHAAQPVLAQAVHNSARPETPQRDTASPSVSVEASAQGSPATAAPDSPISRKASPGGFSGGDGQSSAPDTPKEAAKSAADYDPTADREKDFERAQNCKVEDTKDDEEGDDVDMFGAGDIDDDDEDMFASPKETGANPKPAKSGGTVLRRNLDDAATLENGYFRVLLGELMHGRYHIHNSFGHGAFSEVFDATDQRTGKTVAVKSMRQYGSMKSDAARECELLNQLKEADPENQHIVRLLDSFTHLKHVHLVFEGMKMNLRDVIKKFGSQVGLHHTAVRSYTRQMFLGLSVLHKCELIHGDIKPDNMLVDDSQQLLKLCDFGSAHHISTRQEYKPYWVSRFYRAPEVILGLTLDYALDVWSIGCTIFELATSEVLFRGENNNEMLRHMQESRGKYPPKLVRLGAATARDWNFGTEQQTFFSRKARDVGVKEVTFGSVPLKPLKPRLMGKFPGADDAVRRELGALLELIEACVSFYPERRPKAEGALSSPFIVGVAAPVKKAPAKR